MSDSSLRIGIIPLVSAMFALDQAEETRGKTCAVLDATGATINRPRGGSRTPAR